MAQRISDKIRAYCTDKGFSGEEKFSGDDSNVELENEGDNTVITKWTVDGVDKPSIETLNGYESQAKALHDALVAFNNNVPTLRASVKTKLKALGLTDDELKATFGL